LTLYVLCISAALALGGALLGPTALRLATGLKGADYGAGARLTRLLWLITGMETFNSFLVALFHLKKKFALPSALGLLPVAGQISGTVFLSGAIGVEALPVGWAVMDVISIAVLSRELISGYRFSVFKADLKGAHAKGFLRGLVPVAMTIAPFTALPPIDACITSTLPPGSMSYIGYSTRITVAMSVVVTSGLYVVLLPHLSDNVNDGKMDAFMSNLRSSMKAVVYLAVPLSLFCFIFRGRILEAFLMRGRFDAGSMYGVRSLLPFYLLGLTPMCLSTLVNRAYIARGLCRPLGIFSAIMVCLYAALAWTMSRSFSYMGIGMAYSVYWSVFFIATSLYLSRLITCRKPAPLCVKPAAGRAVEELEEAGG
jgi:peptidoglycan biosynthesis protein MviN/MurJ (putative lipid II flippase)